MLGFTKTEKTDEQARTEAVDKLVQKEKEEAAIAAFSEETLKARNIAKNANIEADKATEKAEAAKKEEEREQDRLAITQKKHEDLNVEVAKLQKERDTTITEVAAEGVKLDEAKKLRKEEETKLTEVQTFLLDLEQAKVDEKEKFDRDCRAFSAKITDLESDIAKAEKDLKLTEDRVSARIAVLDKQIEEAETEMKAGETKIGKLNDEIEGLTGQRDLLLKEIETLKTSIDSLKAEKEEADKATIAAKEAQKVAEAARDAAQAEVKKIEDDKFNVANRSRALDEREALIEEQYIRAGVKYTKV